MKKLSLVLLSLSLAAAAPLRAEVIPVTNLQSSGPGSLNDAIAIANADPSHTDIHFEIPANGPQPAVLMIELNTPLPEITTPVTIDGSTQVTSEMLVRNNTPTPTFEFTTGSKGSVLKSLYVRGSLIELKAPNLLIDDIDVADVGGLGVLIGNHEDIGEEPTGLVIRNSTFTNAHVLADIPLYSVTFAGNTFVRSQIRTFSLGGQAMLDSTVENNSFDCAGLSVSAVEIKHPIRNVFRGNVIKNCPNGIVLWSQTGADTVGHNLVQSNSFHDVALPIVISGRRHAHNKITRNLALGNADEPIKLNGLTQATWGDPVKPNLGKGRPAVTNGYLSGSYFNRKINLFGTTFLTTPTDSVEIFITEGGYTHNPGTDQLVLSPKRHLATVNATNGSWSALLDVGTLGLQNAGPTSFTVTSTDANNNTSEFAVPLTLSVTGF
jgi:hypothetical protein